MSLYLAATHTLIWTEEQDDVPDLLADDVGFVEGEVILNIGDLDECGIVMTGTKSELRDMAKRLLATIDAAEELQPSGDDDSGDD